MITSYRTLQREKENIFTVSESDLYENKKSHLSEAFIDAIGNIIKSSAEVTEVFEIDLILSCSVFELY